MNRNDSNHKLKKVTKTGVIAGSFLEFSSGIIVGMLIGYFIDKYFATSPIFIIIFMVFGFVAGIINLKRYITKNKL